MEKVVGDRALGITTAEDGSNHFFHRTRASEP